MKRSLSYYGVLAFIAVSLVQCSLISGEKLDSDWYDRDLKFSKDDFYTGLQNKKALDKKKKSSSNDIHLPDVPGLSPLLATPVPPSLGGQRLVSLAITEEISLKDVFIELSRLAGVDIQFDSTIQKGIIIQVKERPLLEVIDMIADQAELRYTIDKGTLRIERDTPYIKSYQLDFLNLVRSTEATVSVNTTLENQAQGEGGGSSFSSGSTSSISSSYDGDIWASIETDMNKILDVQEEGAGGAGAAAAAPTQDQANPLAALINPGGAGPAPVAAAAAEPTEQQSFLSINKQAGVLTVQTTQRKHKLIYEYLERVKQNISSQVLIEAKIVEVTLDDQFRAGVRWDMLEETLGIAVRGSFTQNLTGSVDPLAIGILQPSGDAITGDPFTSTTDLEALVNITRTFGTSRTLSSPRLHAINNQQAILSFAENRVYFELDIQSQDAQTTGGGGVVAPPRLTVDSTLKTVPIGIIMTLQPSINLETREITMSIRPTLSRVTGTVPDPAVAFLINESQNANIQNLGSEVPVVEVRELDTILKIKSGQVMVLGGLIEERTINNEIGVPVLSDLPWAGNLFKSSAKTTEMVQTVIFIKATIAADSTASSHDKNFYKTFFNDPNPIRF